ncbi:MAG: acetyltransferase [Gammaproteobacteria bacterium]|nr:acetyltransferase [Gammaproteobacteria bacterium]
MNLRLVNMQLQLLQTDLHDRQGFDCGVLEVNEFLHKHARRQMEQRINRTWVLTTQGAEPSAELVPLLGFFTLTHCSILRSEMPPETTSNRYPRYPLPVIKLALIGVQSEHQRGALRIGETLLLEALLTARQIVMRTGLGIAVITDPLTDKSEQFFLKYGFQRMQREFGQRRTLFLPVKTLQSL